MDRTPDIGTLERPERAGMVRLSTEIGLREMLSRPDEVHVAGAFVVPVNASLAPGVLIRVEVSLAPDVDELNFETVVTEVRLDDDGVTLLTTFSVAPEDLPRMRYVIDVLDGVRVPTARKHRRLPVEIDVRWWWGMRAFTSRAIGLSLGGVFIVCPDAPKVGFRTDVEIRLDSKSAPLRLPATVVWCGDTSRGRGFGVAFRVSDVALAERLDGVVDFFERELTGAGVLLYRE